MNYTYEELETISKSIQKAYGRCGEFNNIMVSLSGGSDSDIMLDLILKTCPKEKLTFVFFDTGIEYEATKRHLNYLEEKYHIVIQRERALMPVPLGCKTYGLPFLSKFVSDMISRLQKHNFDFKNDGKLDFETLCKKYPKCRGALTWWCNENGEKSHFNINTNKYLKEFMIENPPTFKISPKCCQGAKKDTSKAFEQENNFDLKCVGLRKAEGGIRSSAYKNCFEFNSQKKMQDFRPIWHLSDKDKEIYVDLYNIEYSDCYTKYGMKRTGCAGCPFNSKFRDDLDILKEKEPNLYKACMTIFGESYEYTQKYKKFNKEMKQKEKKKATELEKQKTRKKRAEQESRR